MAAVKREGILKFSQTLFCELVPGVNHPPICLQNNATAVICCLLSLFIYYFLIINPVTVSAPLLVQSSFFTFLHHVFENMAWHEKAKPQNAECCQHLDCNILIQIYQYQHHWHVWSKEEPQNRWSLECVHSCGMRAVWININKCAFCGSTSPYR